MHPHTQFALAAADALRRALEALEERAREALRDAEAGNGSGEVSIPSQVFGRRTALGGHGDPTAALALGAWAPGAPEPHAALLGDLMRELDEMACHLPGAPGQDPLDRIRARIPAMRPHVAARTAQALTHLDGQARRRLQMPPDLTPISGQCPACRTRGVLYATGLWVVCRATGCTCLGPPNTRLPDAEREPGCPCGMSVRVEGVAHIWNHTAFATALTTAR